VASSGPGGSDFDSAAAVVTDERVGVVSGAPQRLVALLGGILGAADLPQLDMSGLLTSRLFDL